MLTSAALWPLPLPACCVQAWTWTPGSNCEERFPHASGCCFLKASASQPGGRWHPSAQLSLSGFSACAGPLCMPALALHAPPQALLMLPDVLGVPAPWRLCRRQQAGRPSQLQAW